MLAILVTGENPAKDVYVLECFTDLRNITALRVEALPTDAERRAAQAARLRAAQSLPQRTPYPPGPAAPARRGAGGAGGKRALDYVKAFSGR